MHYLIAYDIADPRRLRRVARRLERSALRCQKSVFVFDGSQEELLVLLEDMRPLLNLKEDVVQAWRLPQGEPASGMVRGTEANVHPACAVVHASGHQFIKGENR